MEATHVGTSHPAVAKTHPLLLVAAASVTVLSLAGVGVLAGWLPGPGAHQAEPELLALPPVSIQQTVSVPPPAKVAATSHQRAPVNVRPVTAPSVATPSVVAAPTVAAAPAPTYAGVAPEAGYRVTPPPPSICTECGVVESVREVAVVPKGSGGGAVAGGLLGGLIANQIGKGATRDIATVLGAVGGAYAGNHIEKSVKESKRYEVLVRFDDGSTRNFSSETAPAWQSGDRVKLQNGALTMGGGNSTGGSGMI